MNTSYPVPSKREGRGMRRSMEEAVSELGTERAR